jgi:hypothetical protein
MVMGADGERQSERKCWRGPAATYSTELARKGYQNMQMARLSAGRGKEKHLRDTILNF